MTAEITDVVSIEEGPGGYYHDGYADSIAVTPDRLYCRTAWGVDSYGHGLVLDVPRRKRWDIQSRAGYQKVGDGFQIITCVGASPDGHRVVAGYKQDNHGTLVLNAFSSSAGKTGVDGQVIGEFKPPRATAVTVAKQGSRYAAYSLMGTSLRCVDVTAPQVGVIPATGGNTIPVPRGSFGLVTVGERVAFIEAGRDAGVCLVGATGFPEVHMFGGSCLASEGDQLLVGVSGGMRRLNGAAQALPATPQALTLLHGVAYAWVTMGQRQKLYREGECLLELPPETWPVVCSAGFGNQLYIGTTLRMMVIRVA